MNSQSMQMQKDLFKGLGQRVVELDDTFRVLVKRRPIAFFMIAIAVGLIAGVTLRKVGS